MDTTDIEMAKLYWEEFKYRHELYWKLFFRFSYAIIFLLVIPYVHPDELRELADFVRLFPIAGMLLSLVAAWLLAAEYKRVGVTYQKFTDIKIPKYRPIKINLSGLGRILALRIGHVVTVTFLAGFLVLSAANLVILCRIPQQSAHGQTTQVDRVHSASRNGLATPSQTTQMGPAVPATSSGPASR